MKTKGQMSLEYLWVYALALVIIIFVFGLVVDFGITSPQDNLPGQCYVESAFECVDYAAYSDINRVRVILKNNVGRSINITSLDFVFAEGNNVDCDLKYDGLLFLPLRLNVSQIFDLNFTCRDETTIPEGK